MNYIVGKASLTLFAILLLISTLVDMGHTFDSRHGAYRKLPHLAGNIYVFMGSSVPMILAFCFGVNTGAGVPDKLMSENDSLRKQLKSYRQHYKEAGK